jgi:hypothetical protein
MNPKINGLAILAALPDRVNYKQQENLGLEDGR